MKNKDKILTCTECKKNFILPYKIEDDGTTLEMLRDLLYNANDASIEESKNKLYEFKVHMISSMNKPLDQVTIEKRGLNDPNLCPECRQKRKENNRRRR